MRLRTASCTYEIGSRKKLVGKGLCNTLFLRILCELNIERIMVHTLTLIKEPRFQRVLFAVQLSFIEALFMALSVLPIISMHLLPYLKQ